MATRTVTEVVSTTITATGTPSSSLRAPPQGGIFEGGNPSVYNPANPIIIFIIQAGIVITFCRLLHWPLSKMRQPRVIAEVIGGILLGPSVMGRIPGFTDAIFPEEAMPNFTLVANLGLVLFLFLVGLEVDLRFLVSNWQIALSVGAAGMALPFGLGAAISWGLYHQFRTDPDIEPISFGTYMLFISIAMAITAFPVLCRILTELKLLGTPVGVIVLSAGVGNDVVGWILLALCVALVNASSGVTAVYILLTAIGYTLALVFVARPGFMLVLRKTRSLQDGPSQAVIALTLLIALTSAFFTGVIGIHPIFGAFLAGLICPHEGGFAIKVTEKVEDLVSALFLPLYFALSGLSTNLGLLNDGIVWAYVVGITATAFFAKVIGGSGAARLNGLVWRECFTIGTLMSCKGLVELIVLNIGLQAKILSTRTFTMFVVMALVTTFLTTPLVSYLYPPSYQKKLEAWKRGEIDWNTGRRLDGSDDDDRSEDGDAVEKIQAQQMGRLLVYLRLDTMPGLLALTSIFGGANDRLRDDLAKTTEQTEAPSSGPSKSAGRSLEIHGVRLVELTERNSSVMKVTEVEEVSAFDPLVNSFRAFGRLHNVLVSGEVVIVPETYYAETLTSRASEMMSDLLVLPWSETGSLSELQTLSSETLQNKLATGPYSEFVEGALKNATCNTAIFVSQGFGGSTKYSLRRMSRTVSGLSMRSHPDRFMAPVTNQTHHVFVPFFGSADDRLAVRFVLQLARDPRLTVTIVHFKMPAEAAEELDLALVASTPVSPANNGNGKSQTTATSTESIPLQDRQAAFLSMMRTSLPADVARRVTMDSVHSTHVADDVLERASREISSAGQNAGDLVVVGRNSATNDSTCLGNVGVALVDSRLETSLLVMQSGRSR